MTYPELPSTGTMTATRCQCPCTGNGSVAQPVGGTPLGLRPNLPLSSDPIPYGLPLDHAISGDSLGQTEYSAPDQTAPSEQNMDRMDSHIPNGRNGFNSSSTPEPHYRLDDYAVPSWPISPGTRNISSGYPSSDPLRRDLQAGQESGSVYGDFSYMPYDEYPFPAPDGFLLDLPERPAQGPGNSMNGATDHPVDHPGSGPVRAPVRTRRVRSHREKRVPSATLNNFLEDPNDPWSYLYHKRQY